MRFDFSSTGEAKRILGNHLRRLSEDLEDTHTGWVFELHANFDPQDEALNCIIILLGFDGSHLF